MKDYDVTQIDGIVISSGDGLLYEVNVVELSVKENLSSSTPECICTGMYVFSMLVAALWNSKHSAHTYTDNQWPNGKRRLGGGYKNTHWHAAHWLRQCLGSVNTT